MIAAILLFPVVILTAAGQFTFPEDGLFALPLVFLAFLGTPTNILLNALRMDLAAQSLNRRFGFAKALSTTVIARAANMLPLPGAAMARFASLFGHGRSVRVSGSITLALSVL